MRQLLLVLMSAVVLPGAIIPEVRVLVAKQDLAGAAQLIDAQRSGGAWTPELLEAHSWLGRGALAAKQYDVALGYARSTRKLALDLLKTRKLDDEKRLPIALGATIEVEGQALAGKRELSEALAFLSGALKTYRLTSMRARIQKNINLLSLVGKKAPELEVTMKVGDVALKTLASLRGKPVLLFFWAHWCGDCKAEVGIIAELARTYGKKGLTVIGPTQHYGYVAGGEDAKVAEETSYIAKIYREYYAGIAGMSVPLSEENFRVYGASTTPTLVLIDKAGVVRLYNPGNLTMEQLVAAVRGLL